MKGCENMLIFLVLTSNKLVTVIDTCFWLLQIKPSQDTSLLMAKNSTFQKFIEIGNLTEAALIANSFLLSVLQETSMGFQERYKVDLKRNLLLKKWNKTSSLWSYPKSKEFTERAKHAKKREDNKEVVLKYIIIMIIIINQLSKNRQI